MPRCIEGHENAEGQSFCGTCGEPLNTPSTTDEGDRRGVTIGDLSADGFFVAMSLIAVGCLVMFVAALLGAGDANGSQDKFDTYAYLAGLGGGTWLLGTLVAWGLAAWRLRVLGDEYR